MNGRSAHIRSFAAAAILCLWLLAVNGVFFGLRLGQSVMVHTALIRYGMVKP